MQLERLTWRPFGRKQPVLRELDLLIEPGERILLAGPSGAGKSTLLRAIAGLLTAVDSGELSGSATIDGHPPGSRPGEVGLVLQEPGAAVVAATVERDVAFGLENLRRPRESMPPLVAESLAAVGLDLPLDTPTSALSGGQTQRLAIAGALALAPSVLLLDEPTAMLDPEHARQVRHSVRRVLDAQALTCVVVDHQLGPWVELTERLVVLDHDGSIIADGPIDELLRARREDLLDRGIWVPGEAPPVPLGVLWPPFEPARTLRATPLTIERSASLLDGTWRTVVAARTAEPIAPRPGEYAALIGPSGAGKSTVLHALAGFLRPVQGHVEVARGETVQPVTELDSRDLARVVAWVPQWASSAVTARTVLDEVCTTSDALGRDRLQTRVRAGHVLQALGLEHLGQADPRQLSGGEQRRLALAAALVHDPAVALLDEPTIGQDRHTWAAVTGLVAAYRAAGGAVVAATHDSFAIERAHRVYRLTAPDRPSPPQSPRRPLLSRAGPLSLLAAALLAVPAGVISPRWWISALALALEIVLVALGLIAPGDGPAPPRWKRLSLRLLPGLLAALSVGWSTWLLAGHRLEPSFLVALRVLVIVVPSVALLMFLDPDRLGDQAAQRLHLPDRPVVAVVAAIQRVQTFRATLTELTRVRRVRGIAPRAGSPKSVLEYLGALTLGLLVRTLRSAADLAIAMDARGFARAYRRTWYAPATWHAADTILLALASLPLVLVISLSILIHG